MNMNADIVAMMLDATYSQKAVWRMTLGGLETSVVGMIIAATPDSFRVQAEQGDTYTLAMTDVLTLVFV